MATQIFIGDDHLFSFNNETIIDVSINTAVDPIQNELSADVLEFTVIYDDTLELLRNTEWATAIYVYKNDSLVGKFYFTNISRIANDQYTINATSVIGLIDGDTFYGGMYHGADFEDVIRQIILTNGFSSRGICKTLRRGHYGDVSYSGAIPTHFHAIPYGIDEELPFAYACIETEFKLYKCILNELDADPFPNKTSVQITLLGEVASESLRSKSTAKATILKNRNYGIYMIMSRASVSDPWPDYGGIYFSYGDQVFPLGTPTEPTKYTVSIISEDKTAVINGATYTLTYSAASLPNWAINVGTGYYGGGVESDLDSAENYIRITPPVYCDIEYGEQTTYIKTWGTIGYQDVTALNETLEGKLYLVIDNLTSPEPYGWAKHGEFYEIQKAIQPYQTEYVNGANFDAVQSIKIYGWIPICTKREALHQVLFATGVSILKDDNGNAIFTGLPDNQNIIEEKNVYIGGSSEKIERVNTIEITEHSFIYDEGSAEETVYETDSNSTIGVYIAKYTQQPVYEGSIPTITDGSIVIHDYTCNACAFTGNGKINQQVYKHGEKTVYREIGSFEDGKTVTVDDFSLITLQNSGSVLDRLESYYTSDSIIEMDVVHSNEKCGIKFQFTNPFHELTTAFLSKMEKKFSGIVKAACEFISGFTPPQPGGGYTNFALLSGSGTWNVPNEVYEKENPRIRIVVIGGGNGGESGLAGNNGVVTPLGGSGADGALGGSGGNAGAGGLVYEVTVDNPQPSYTYSCGTGGAGGGICTSTDTPNTGESGTITTISDGIITYSSENGTSLADGHLNILSGEIFAKPWIPVGWNDIEGQGGVGGHFYVIEYSGQTYIWRVPAQNVFPISGTGEIVASGGENGTDYPPSGEAIATGGGGGGGAIGGTATNGTNARYSGGKYYAGNGGNGANAVAVPPKATDYNQHFYGYGGCGGYGGGAGGNSGYAPSGGVTGAAGTGGYGGKGGTGGDGCVIIYY